MNERRLITAILLAAVLLALLNLPDPAGQRLAGWVRDAVLPLQQAVTRVGRKLAEGVRTVRGFGGLVRDYQAMAEELARLRQRVQELQAYETENRELRRQLEYVRSGQRRLIPCEVVARDMTGWWRTVRVNKGRRHGVDVNMAVITTDGLLGRTTEVSERTADVLLLSDPLCRVAARVLPSGAFGVIEGMGSSPAGQALCRMRFINRNLPVLPGQSVITAGLGGVFPGGLPIGYVEQVQTDDSGLYQSAVVVAHADVGAATYVFVVAPEEETAR